MSAERVSESVRSTLLSFSNGDRQQYAPKSGEIIGILKRLKDEMSAHLSAAQKAEGDRKANQAGLREAGLREAKKELATLMAFIEATLTRQVSPVVEVEEEVVGRRLGVRPLKSRAEEFLAIQDKVIERR